MRNFFVASILCMSFAFPAKAGLIGLYFEGVGTLFNTQSSGGAPNPSNHTFSVEIFWKAISPRHPVVTVWLSPTDHAGGTDQAFRTVQFQTPSTAFLGSYEESETIDELLKIPTAFKYIGGHPSSPAIINSVKSNSGNFSLRNEYVVGVDWLEFDLTVVEKSVRHIRHGDGEATHLPEPATLGLLGLGILGLGAAVRRRKAI